MRGFRLSVDIGGTFTDATLVDDNNGAVGVAKVPTTPGDPSNGFAAVVERLLGLTSAGPAEVGHIVHATTVATNAVIEHRLARTAFVTTEGFTDLLEIARQIRPKLYDLRFVKPPPLVPRDLTFGVPERMDARGNVIKSLDESAVRGIAARIRESGVESVAVCLLHSYANPEHELRVGAILETELPATGISLSSDVAPEFREYLRASTTVINAGVQPLVDTYLTGISARLAAAGINSPLLIMQSGGSVMTTGAARIRPVFMLESGPAAGAVAAAHLGRHIERPNVISLDMGGTTAKVCLIEHGQPAVTREYQVGQQTSGGTSAFGGASGYPVRTPVVDLVEIGAGGGSVAWVDSGGALRVGPQSAGADPGPACYGAGGQLPTITDANLVLGRLNPARFLGGELELDVDAAARAIDGHCAAALGLTTEAAAAGILRVANAAMINALRLVSVQRGKAPRDFVMMAFGGAGPVHAVDLAAEFPCAAVVIPPDPGTFSALGLLATDLRHDFTYSLLAIASDLDSDATEAILRGLEAEGEKALRRDGIPPSRVELRRSADLRYRGQSFELHVPIPSHPFDDDVLESVERAFHAEHQATYGFSVAGEPIELVNLRVTAIGTIDKPTPRARAALESSVANTPAGTRPVYFFETGSAVEAALYERDVLPIGARFTGPAIIEESNSTTVISPGSTAEVDELGNIWINTPTN